MILIGEAKGVTNVPMKKRGRFGDVANMLGR